MGHEAQREFSWPRSDWGDASLRVPSGAKATKGASTSLSSPPTASCEGHHPERMQGSTCGHRGQLVRLVQKSEALP